MSQAIEVVSAVQVLRPYLLEVTFTNGVQGYADVEPCLQGEVFAPLRDPARFAEAFVDADAGTVVSPNGADLSPEFLYATALANPGATRNGIPLLPVRPAGGPVTLELVNELRDE
jgi:hypothetical protein